MAQPNPGRRTVREYCPPELDHALSLCRLANAWFNGYKGESWTRFRVVANRHEAIDPGNIGIGDFEDGTIMSVAELQLMLPPSLRI